MAIQQRKAIAHVRVTIEVMREWTPWRRHPFRRLRIEWQCLVRRFSR